MLKQQEKHRAGAAAARVKLASARYHKSALDDAARVTLIAAGRSRASRDSRCSRGSNGNRGSKDSRSSKGDRGKRDSGNRDSRSRSTNSNRGAGTRSAPYSKGAVLDDAARVTLRQGQQGQQGQQR